MYEYELVKAARTLVEDMFQLDKNEVLIITADTESDQKVVEATAACAHAIGAKPMVICLPSPQGVGKAADSMLPVDALVGSLSHADAWVEFNNQWLLYSTPFEKAIDRNPSLRYLCLVGMNVDMMVRTIGRINHHALSTFLKKITEIIGQSKSMRITSPAGTDIVFNMEPTYPVICDDGNASAPGIHMLGGQISIFPRYESITGTLVFDGSVTPPCGLLKEPIHMTAEKGRITSITGGAQAVEFLGWLNSFDDPNMFHLAHCSYGFNPGAKLTGNVLEDERVWGCMEWGLGYVSHLDAPPGIDAKSHTDGICLKASVWLDDHQIMDQGAIIDENLKPLLQGLVV